MRTWIVIILGLVLGWCWQAPALPAERAGRSEAVAVCCAAPAACVSATAAGLAASAPTEWLCACAGNSDLCLPTLHAVAAPVRTVAFRMRAQGLQVPLVAASGTAHSRSCARLRRAYFPDAGFAGGSPTDFYVYGLRRLLI